jgi:hypothetical protein
MDLLRRSWCWPIYYAIGLPFVCLDSFCGNAVPKKMNFCTEEFRFLRVAVEAVVC